MVRVRQLDLCIDCKLCEEACEERYGARRLTLGGYQLGMLDFIYTCRTCTDQRCIDPCAYDSIKYDEAKKEVVINEATCTGCTACAQSCPYGAIDMVEVEPDAPTFKKDFKHAARQEERARVRRRAPAAIARARRIANKCDHCIAYGDQACVSACPTGSLIEINAYDLFRERSPAMAQLAQDRLRPRSDRSASASEVLPVMPFTEGLDVRSGGLAKIKRGRYAPLADVDRRPARVPGRVRRGAAPHLRADDVVPVQPAQGARPSSPTSPTRAIAREGRRSTPAIRSSV